MSVIDQSKPENRALLQTMRNLVAEFGTEDVSRAWAEVKAPLREAHWAKKQGLKVSGGSCCVGRVAGRRCSYGECCRPPGCDHPSLWNLDGSPAVFVFQPYGLSDEDIQALAAFARDKKLELEIDAQQSWWFPGASVLVALWAPWASKLLHERWLESRK